MGLSHIPTVASIVNRFAKGAHGLDSDIADDAFDAVITELEEVRDSWRTTAKAVGGKPENAFEYVAAGDAISRLADLQQMGSGKWTITTVSPDAG